MITTDRILLDEVADLILCHIGGDPNVTFEKVQTALSASLIQGRASRFNVDKILERTPLTQAAIKRFRLDPITLQPIQTA
jgi:hypothetical protein